MVKFNRILFIYLFFMKKILIFLWFLVTWINSVFAIWKDESEQTAWFFWLLKSIFTIELFLNIIFAILVILGTLILSKIVTAKASHYLEKSYDWVWTGREDMIWVVTRTLNITIFSIWWSIVLTLLWIDLGFLLGWFWFGLGFTMKSFLSNFVSGIMMVTQWIYHNWDVIKIWNIMWRIKKINSLFTVVEQFNWVMYYVPNFKFSEENVENYYSNDKRRVDVEVLVDYSTDIVKAKMIVKKVLETFPNILKAPKLDIIVEKLDNNWILLINRFWVWSKEDFFHLKSNITETINLAFKQSGITIPFPQVTLSNRDNFKIDLNK